MSRQFIKNKIEILKTSEYLAKKGKLSLESLIEILVADGSIEHPEDFRNKAVIRNRWEAERRQLPPSVFNARRGSGRSLNMIIKALLHLLNNRTGDIIIEGDDKMWRMLAKMFHTLVGEEVLQQGVISLGKVKDATVLFFRAEVTRRVFFRRTSHRESMIRCPETTVIFSDHFMPVIGW